MVFLRRVPALARNDSRALALAVLAAWIVAALAEAAALLGVMDRLGSFGPGVAVVAQLMIALGGSAENWLKDPLWDNSHWVVRLGVRREAMAAARTVANLALFVLPLAVTLLAAEGGGGVLRNTGDLAWPLAAVVVLAPLPAMFFRRLWQVIALDIAALMAFSLVFADAHERPVWRWDRGWWPAPAAIGILLGLTCLAAAQRTRIRAVLVLSAGLAALAAVTFRMKAY